MLKNVLAAAAATLALGLANAAPFDGGIVVEGGGSPVVYDLGGNEYLGLLGLQGAEAGDTVDLQSILELTTADARISAIYAAEDDNFTGAFAFDDISAGADIAVIDRAGDGRLFNALFVRFTGTSNIVFSSIAGTATLGFNVNNVIAENPLGEVPVPAALPLMAAGLAGLFGASRRRKQA